MLTTVWIPAKENRSDKVLVALHGLGDSPEGYRWLPEALQLPWLNYTLAQAPDSYFNGFSWYDIYGMPAPGIARSRKELFALLEDLEKKGFPAEKITLLGFSQGCLMSMEAAATYPGRLAGIVGISGYFHETTLTEQWPPVARQQRILMTHGTADPLIPIAQVRPQVEKARAAGLQIDWREFHKAHTIAGDEEVEVIRKFIQAGYAL